MPSEAELLQFEAADGLILPGLLFRAPRSSTAAIYLHGNGDASVFYAQRTNLLADLFVDRGVSFFPFNNRGAYLVKRLTKAGAKKRKSATRGTSYERIRECIPDIEGAVKALRSRGYRRIVLIGHSTGANKICVYNYHRRRNPIDAFVLLGPADDMGLYFEPWGRRRFENMLRQARRAIRAGRKWDLAPRKLTPFPISWMSLYDTINPEGDYNIFPFLDVMRDLRLSRKSRFREFRALRKPTLTIFGDRDEFCFGDVQRCLEILAGQARGRRGFTFRLLPDADHGFHGRERDLAGVMLDWIDSLRLRR